MIMACAYLKSRRDKTATVLSTIPTAESRLANTTATTVQQTSNIIKEKIMLVFTEIFSKSKHG
jgi:hypothetical protein